MSSNPKSPGGGRPRSDSEVETYRLPRWDSQGNLIPESRQSVSSEDVEEAEVQLPTAEEIRQIHEDAYNEGFESGYEQGMRQGQTDGHKQGHQEGYRAGEEVGREAGEKAGFEAARAAEDERIETELKPLATLFEQLKSTLPEQENALKEGLVVLATRIARNVIDAELSLNPEHITSLAHAAVQALPNADERLIVELNPADEALVARVAESHWTLEPNESIARGGCIVRTRFSYIDYTLEHRYRQQIANLLAHLGLTERLTELERPWPLPEAEPPAVREPAPEPDEDVADAGPDEAVDAAVDLDAFDLPEEGDSAEDAADDPEAGGDEPPDATDPETGDHNPGETTGKPAPEPDMDAEAEHSNDPEAPDEPSR